MLAVEEKRKTSGPQFKWCRPVSDLCSGKESSIGTLAFAPCGATLNPVQLVLFPRGTHFDAFRPWGKKVDPKGSNLGSCFFLTPFFIWVYVEIIFCQCEKKRKPMDSWAEYSYIFASSLILRQMQILRDAMRVWNSGCNQTLKVFIPPASLFQLLPLNGGSVWVHWWLTDSYNAGDRGRWRLH